MNGALITVVSALIVCYALLARSLTMVNLTAPMLSIVAGFLFFSVSDAHFETVFMLTPAEITLVFILFHDASTIRFNQLRHDPGIALRLLAVGFPLALLATFLVTKSMFPVLGGAGALLIAAAITPTDAGLGAPTVLNPIVPLRVRRGLNVESGLNDGLATPIVLVSLSMLAAQEDEPLPDLMGIGVAPVLLAVGCAIVVSLAGAWCMDRSRERHFSGHRGRQVALLFLPTLIFGVAGLTGANVFIAAFLGGLVFGFASTSLAQDHEIGGLLETAADLLGFVVWFLFGAVILRVLHNGLHWQWILMAVLALTVLRIVPVALAMIGSGFRRNTVLFLGWFGPRGLATIVFGLLALEELGRDSPVLGDVAGVLTVTVILSVLLHGLTAGPLSKFYGEMVARTEDPVGIETSAEPMTSRGRTGR